MGEISEEKLVDILMASEKRFAEVVDKKVARSEVKIIGMLGQMNEKFDKKFEQIDEKFGQIDERFKKVDERFDKLEANMNARMDKIDSRMDKIDARMGKMDARMDKIDSRMDRMESDIKSVKEIMNRNFEALADNQITTYNKLTELTERVENIEFRVGVTESAISYNSKNNEVTKGTFKMLKK